MISGNDLARAGCKYLGTPYSVLDCQAFVEKCLSACGEKTNLPGSNAWYRKVKSEGWVGTPEECLKTFKTIPPGAFLFILDNNGKEPAKYQGDGIGNASHIGIYTAMTGKEMVDLGKQEGDAIAAGFNYGNGAIHSSQSRGAVCTSTFTGKTISGGWNRVGLWLKSVRYDDVSSKEQPTSSGGDSMLELTYQAKVKGGKLNLRKEPDVNAERICSIPDGMTVIVTADNAGWSRVMYGNYTGWVKSEFLEEVMPEDQKLYLSRTWLEGVLKRIDNALKELESISDEIAEKIGGRG